MQWKAVSGKGTGKVGWRGGFVQGNMELEERLVLAVLLVCFLKRNNVHVSILTRSFQGMVSSVVVTGSLENSPLPKGWR